MLYPIHVLEDAEAKIAGMPIARELAGLSFDRVTIELRDPSLRGAMWCLPVVDAVLRAYPRAAADVCAPPRVARLLSEHLRSEGGRPMRAGGARALRVWLSPRAQGARLERTASETTLIVPHAPFRARAQHASAHWIDGAHAAGLDARSGAPRLRLPRDAERRARRLCRTLVGARGGPMVAILPSASGRGWGAEKFAAVLARLGERIGAVGIVLGDEDIAGARRVPENDPAVLAALLALAAVCVADEDDWAHVAAAAGAPVVTVHGESCPIAFGPASRHGAAAYTTKGTCDACLEAKGRRCLACLAPEKVAGVAEELSSSGWPWDRVARVLP